LADGAILTKNLKIYVVTQKKIFKDDFSKLIDYDFFSLLDSSRDEFRQFKDFFK
jgi:hypothetical protein